MKSNTNHKPLFKVDGSNSLRAFKRSHCYEHQILNNTSQSLKLNERWPMTQHMAVQCRHYTIYKVQLIMANITII